MFRVQRVLLGSGSIYIFWFAFKVTGTHSSISPTTLLWVCMVMVSVHLHCQSFFNLGIFYKSLCGGTIRTHLTLSCGP